MWHTTRTSEVWLLSDRPWCVNARPLQSTPIGDKVVPGSEAPGPAVSGESLQPVDKAVQPVVPVTPAVVPVVPVVPAPVPPGTIRRCDTLS
jgi:hypothetical protein